VDDRGERVFGGDAIQKRLEFAAIGGIAGGERNMSAERTELGGQRLCSRCIRATSRREPYVLNTMVLDELTGDQFSEGACTSGHEHSAVRIEHALL
jgi:hypothetical protein